MATMKGFTTRKKLSRQLSKSGAKVTLPFFATSFKTSKNPFKKLELKDRQGNDISRERKPFKFEFWK